MRNTFFIILSFLITFHTASAQSAEDIINMHLKARGGKSALDSLSSYKLSGTQILGGLEIKTDIYQKSNNLVRMETSAEKNKTIVCSDGKNAWVSINDTTTSIPVSRVRSQSIMPSMITKGPFAAFDKSVKSVKYFLKDTVEINKRKTYVIRMRLYDSSGSYGILCYIAADDYSLVKTGIPVKRSSTDNVIEILYDSYKWIDGINIPTEIKIINNKINFEFKIDKIFFNPALDDSLFTKPD